MSNPAWKRTERAIAGRLGGQRVPVSGRGRSDAPDIAHDRLSIEVKHRATLPAWLLDALGQAEAAARDEQLPVAILHAHGRRHGANLCVMSLDTLAALLAGLAATEAPEGARHVAGKVDNSDTQKKTPMQSRNPHARSGRRRDRGA